jgi:hypothetical protein
MGPQLRLGYATKLIASTSPRCDKPGVLRLDQPRKTQLRWRPRRGNSSTTAGPRLSPIVLVLLSCGAGPQARSTVSHPKSG